MKQLRCVKHILIVITLSAIGCSVEHDDAAPSTVKRAPMPKIKARLRDGFDLPTTAEVQRFEAEIGRKLPADYREFLLTSNGGQYHDYVSSEDGFGVDNVFGLNTGFDWSDLRRQRNVSSDWLPPDLLPIASDAGGNYALLKLADPHRGAIFTFIPELEDEPKMVADSFAEFMEGIILDRDSLAEYAHDDVAFQAINLDDLDGFTRLLDNGLEVDHSEPDGTSLLMHAAWKCRLEIVDLLVSRGANIHARDDRGQTPVFYSVFTHSPSCLKQLVALGGNVNDTNKDGESVLMRAVSNASEPCVLVLIELGADVKYQAPDGSTPLSCCLLNSLEEIRRLLLKAGARQ